MKIINRRKKIACFFSRLNLCRVNFHWFHFNISGENIITWNWCVHRNFAELDCVICQSWHLESRQHTYTQETIVPLFFTYSIHTLCILYSSVYLTKYFIFSHHLSNEIESKQFTSFEKKKIVVHLIKCFTLLQIEAASIELCVFFCWLEIECVVGEITKRSASESN